MTARLRIAAAAALLLMTANIARAEGLCAAAAGTPDHWLPMRLIHTASRPATHGPAAPPDSLVSVAFGEVVSRRLRSITAEAVVGACTRQDRSIAQTVRDSAVIEAGCAWR